MQYDKLVQVGARLLPAIAYGDAFGLPFKKTDPDPERNVHQLTASPRGGFVGAQPPGTWSDVTHLSVATAIALLAAQGFDMHAQARYHMIAHDSAISSGSASIPANIGDYGIPAAIITARYGIGQVLDISEIPCDDKAICKLKSGIPYDQSGSKDSHDNGILAKIAPLVYWQICENTTPSSSADQISTYTRMTHDNEDSVALAIFWAEILERAYRGKPLPKVDSDFDIRDIPKRGFLASEAINVVLYYFAQEPRFSQNIQLAIKFGGYSNNICGMLGALSVFAGTYDPPYDLYKLYDIHRIYQLSDRLSQFFID